MDAGNYRAVRAVIGARGLAPAAAALITLLCILILAISAASAGPSRPWVELIEINGSINPAVANYIGDSIARAENRGAAALVIRLDTPGGLLSSAKRIVEAMLGARVPIIVYVAPEGASAASAGTFVTEAANIAAMAPGTTIGAAHPVLEGGAVPKGAYGKKIENYTAAFAQSIARTRGRNQQWVQKAVRQSSALGETDALKLHVIDLIAPDLRSLLNQASGRQVKAGGRIVTLNLADALVRRHRMTLGERVLNTLANPDLMYLFLMAGLVGLYFEFAHPHVFFPGVAGAICLLLALTSSEVLPVNLSGLLLILLGVALLASEAFVRSYGVMGLGGVISFVLGSLFLINTSETTATVNRGLIAGVAIGVSAIILALGYLAAREYSRRAATGAEGMIGTIGQVRQAIAPGVPGRILVRGEVWRATSDAAIEPGARVEVTAVKGLEIEVRRKA